MNNNKKSNWQFVDQLVAQTATDVSSNNPIWRKHHPPKKSVMRNIDAKISVGLNSSDSFSRLKRKEPDLYGYNHGCHEGFGSKLSISDNQNCDLSLNLESKDYSKKGEDDYLFNHYNHKEAEDWMKYRTKKNNEAKKFVYANESIVDENIPRRTLSLLSSRSTNQGLPIFQSSNCIPKSYGTDENLEDYIKNTRENRQIESLGRNLEIITRTPCLVKDIFGQIPLHIATKVGDLQTMNSLIKACPQSLLAITPLKESALHLAIKHNQIDAFEVLLKSVYGFNDYNILEMKDYEGNNVLHIAVLRKQMQILEWLLYKNPLGGPLVRVHSRNRCGLTALGLHLQNITQYDDVAITGLLESAEVRSMMKLSHPDINKDHYASNTLLLAVTILVAGSIYTSIFNFSTLENQNSHRLQIMDIIRHPDLLPDVAYTITLMTVAFTSSIAGIAKAIWSIVDGSSFCYKALFCLALSSFFLSYAFTVRLKIPMFSVTCAFGTMTSFWFMWLFVAYLFMGTSVLWFIRKLINVIL